MTSAKVIISVATILGPVVLLLLALSFSTNNWVEYEVDRRHLSPLLFDQSTKDIRMSHFHSRSRGLFRECFTDDGQPPDFLIGSANTIDKTCINIRYEVSNEEKLTDVTADVYTRIHLLRCHFGFLIVGLVSFVIAYMLGVVLCCQEKPSWAKAAGICSFLSAFATAASIAFFHGAEYVERNNIKDNSQYYSQWPQELIAATTRSYGWSYALAWAGAGVAAIVATLYVSAAWVLQKRQHFEDSREILAKRFQGRNLGPVMMGDQHYPEDPYGKYFVPRTYPAPVYLQDVQDNPAYAAHPGVDQGQWSWQ